MRTVVVVVVVLVVCCDDDVSFFSWFQPADVSCGVWGPPVLAVGLLALARYFRPKSENIVGYYCDGRGSREGTHSYMGVCLLLYVSSHDALFALLISGAFFTVIPISLITNAAVYWGEISCKLISCERAGTLVGHLFCRYCFCWGRCPWGTATRSFFFTMYTLFSFVLGN